MAKSKPQVVNFELEVDRECVALAQLGMGNAFIESQTGLTRNQIIYRLTKAKVAEGYKAGHTYRSEWKSGTSFASRQVINSLGKTLADDAEKRLPKLFTKPTPRVSPQGR